MSNQKKLFLGIIGIIPLLLAWSLFDQFSEGDESPESSDQITEASLNSKCKYYGYWDHLYSKGGGEDLLSFVNYGQSQGAYKAREIISQGIKAIPSISHSLLAEETVEEWRVKLRGHKQILDDYSPDDVVMILLMDEPFGKGFTTEQLELMVSEAKDIIGTDYKYSFTFTRGSIWRKKLPQNLDIYVLNFYPFFEKDYAPNSYIRKESEFKNQFYSLIKKARDKTPDGSTLFITGQGFKQPGKWAMPPVDSPIWYSEVVQKEDDIAGLGWFELRDRQRWVGSGSLPELYESQKKAFEVICPEMSVNGE